MAGLIDVAAERDRLGKALARSQADLTRVEAKLANRQFADNAPAAVVDKEREKLRAARQEIYPAEPAARAPGWPGLKRRPGWFAQSRRGGPARRHFRAH